MTMFKKNGGFTLVELIVVIAILAILAGVAIPAYTGYIAKAQQSADMLVLSSVSTAAQGLAAAEGDSVTAISVSAAGAVTVTTSGDSNITSASVLTLTGTLSFTEKFNGATWANTDGVGKWTANYS